MGRVRETTGPFPFVKACRSFDMGEKLGVVFQYPDALTKAVLFTADELLSLRGETRA